MISKKKRKKHFSGFTKAEALKQLNLTDIPNWIIDFQSRDISDFFKERLSRLERHFDLESCEESKKLLIDAICEEALEPFNRLKMWKGAGLSSDQLIGEADYLIAEKKAYLEAPFLCIIEAKKDDFDKGLAQCLVEMQACQWQNRQIGRNINVLGIVTNGEGWQFYKLTSTGEVYKTLLYGIGNMRDILGLLNYIFQECENNLDP